MRAFIMAWAAAAFIASATVATAQHHGAPRHAAPPAGTEPQGLFGVRSYGAFRIFMQYQDYSPRIDLATAKAADPTEGVGALSGLRGEISMIDGRYIVSYGGECGACPPPHEEKAALLGTGRVRTWHPPLILPETLLGEALDDFVLAQARAKGIDTAKPFPVRLSGTLIDVEMHVLEAPNADFIGHGPEKKHMARQKEFRHARLEGEVVGFHAPDAMVGILLTHPGEPFHFHWIDTARTRTAHLDSFGMLKGASLLLPKE